MQMPGFMHHAEKSFFDLRTGPDYIVLYQKNIEAVCSSDAEIRDQIRRTVIHELGHYFGMDEDQLKCAHTAHLPTMTLRRLGRV
jgi:predicted Zn-dependent protease with MMP-like domain